MALAIAHRIVAGCDASEANTEQGGGHAISFVRLAGNSAAPVYPEAPAPVAIAARAAQ